MAQSKEEHYAKRNETVRKRKEELVKQHGGVCADCGFRYEIHMWDFHHIDPAIKSFTITGKNLTRRWVDVLAESEKCALLCPNCHRQRHWELANAGN